MSTDIVTLTKTTLKACPFCGSEFVMVSAVHDYRCRHKPNCLMGIEERKKHGAETTYIDIRSIEIVERWNTRAL